MGDMLTSGDIPIDQNDLLSYMLERPLVSLHSVYKFAGIYCVTNIYPPSIFKSLL